MPERQTRRNAARRKAGAKPAYSRPKSSRSKATNAARRELQDCVRLIERICRVAGNPNLIRDARRRLSRRGILTAIRRHDSAVFFDWLGEAVSFRDIANSVAYGYIQ